MAQGSQSSTAETLIAVIGVTALLCVLVPVGVFSPALFGGIPISTLGSKAITFGVTSFIVGAWYFVAFIALNKSQKKTAPNILHGLDLGLLIIPYVIYAGTKAFFSNRKR